jgi:hypothetical protein
MGFDSEILMLTKTLDETLRKLMDDFRLNGLRWKESINQ